MEHTYCVIMAGGRGERFWPLSTELVPKPFLKLVGDKTMIQLTVERALRIVPRERIFIILGRAHIEIAKKQLEDLPDENFIVEPEGKDTAPCIGFAAVSLLKIDSKAIMVTLPADHYIPDMDGFAKVISHGVKIARIGDYLITVGINPIRPETGYGYINAYERFGVSGDVECYRVNRFVEKPDFSIAIQYIEEGNYYWNSGMFIWQTDAVLRGIERHMPDLHDGLSRIQDALVSNDREAIGAIYKNLARRSIDYGLMEKADNVLMIPSYFRWDDIGTWASLLRVLEVDEHGNYIKGDAICFDTRNCVIYGDDLVVGTIGVSHLVIVASKDGILICGVDRAQEVRKIVNKLSS